MAQAVASPARVPPGAVRSSRRDRTLALVAALTAVALALRLPQFSQSLYGDELFAYDEVANRSLGSMWHAVNHGLEVTPPLFFLLAWPSSKLGDPAVWLRLPSLLAGVALVPVTFWLGLLTAGRRAGLVAASAIALSPHAIFYSVEARPYALLALTVAGSAVCLLRALATRRAAWWAAYGALCAAALCTHLTSAFALGAQALWAAWFHRDQLRPLIAANAAAAVAIAPWLPRLLRDDVGWLLDLYGPFTWDVSEFADEAAHLLVGYPFASLESIPRAPVVAAFLAALAYAVVAAALSLRRRRRHRRPERSDVLVALVPLAVIGGLVLDSARSDHDLVSARNAMAAFPFVAILLGRLVARLPRREGAAVGAVMLAALAIGAVTALGERGQRPPFRDAAAYIERSARPGDVVVDRSPFDAYGELGRALTLHLAVQLDDDIARVGVRPVADVAGPAAGAARAAARRDGRVFVVQNHPGEPPLPRTIGSGYTRLDARVFPGLLPVTVTRYGRG
jgi:mannosyltransferase